MERQTASLPKLPTEAQVSPSGRAWNPEKGVLSASTWRVGATRLLHWSRSFSLSLSTAS